jgi:chorismate mutase / prephenate dehydratase
MKTLKIVCLGPAASFSHLAAKQYFGDHAQYLFMSQLNAGRAIRQHRADFAVLPVENNTGGFVNETLDALYWTSQIVIHDEIYCPIHQHLISSAKNISDVQEIHSHPQAFVQCRGHLDRLQAEAGHPIRLVKVDSTSEGVMTAQKNSTKAAIGSSEAAEFYEVPILRPDLQDRPDNATRFFVVKLGKVSPPTERDRSAFLLEVDHEPGALAHLLRLFGNSEINLLSLDTRPVHRGKGTRWDYSFFLECEGHVYSEPLRTVYRALHSGRLRGQRFSSTAL